MIVFAFKPDFFSYSSNVWWMVKQNVGVHDDCWRKKIGLENRNYILCSFCICALLPYTIWWTTKKAIIVYSQRAIIVCPYTHTSLISFGSHCYVKRSYCIWMLTGWFISPYPFLQKEIIFSVWGIIVVKNENYSIFSKICICNR